MESAQQNWRAPAQSAPDVVVSDQCWLGPAHLLDVTYGTCLHSISHAAGASR